MRYVLRSPWSNAIEPLPHQGMGNIRTFILRYSHYKYLVGADLYRQAKAKTLAKLLRNILFGDGFKVLFWLRTCQFTKSRRLGLVVYPFAKLMLRRVSRIYGVAIPEETRIGAGFLIGHYGCIVVNGKAIIGNNCSISHGVTIGKANRGRNKGYPTIGDGVYIGPGAKIIGSVTVGDNVAVGANCVVTSDVPDNAVVVGVPGRVISYQGACGYVNSTDY